MAVVSFFAVSGGRLLRSNGGSNEILPPWIYRAKSRGEGCGYLLVVSAAIVDSPAGIETGGKDMVVVSAGGGWGNLCQGRVSVCL